VADQRSERPLATADPHLVGVYLNDHLAGSVAGSHRFRRMAETLHRTPVGAEIAQVADEVAGEREELRQIIQDRHMTTQNFAKQAAAWVGERVARLKASRSAVRRSTMRALLEVELLRSALVGKLGLWQTLEDLAGELDVDPVRMRELREQTVRQIATLDHVHEYVRVRALLAKKMAA
jgi:hypothetical protein